MDVEARQRRSRELRIRLLFCALAAMCAGGLGIPGAARAVEDWTVANLNILHGLGCDPDNCRLPDRIDLLFEWIEDAGCPDIVTLQEVNNTLSVQKALPLILAGLPTLCGGQYEGNTRYAGVNDLDEEMVLTADPIIQSSVRIFHSAGFNNFTRHALHVRVSGTPGEVDVITTHLASGTDNATSPCDIDIDGDEIIDTPCPQECVDAGAVTVRECQVVQLVEFVADVHGTRPPAIVTGDFNAEPSSNEYAHIESQGWRDSYLVVGNPECNPGTGVGCTGGRDSSTPAELESTTSNVSHRIDYAFLAPSPSFCVYSLDGPNDDDGDGTATRIFADDPNPFASCGASPLEPCWPSDHEGNELDMNIHECDISEPIPALPAQGVALLAALLWMSATFVALRRLSVRAAFQRATLR